MISTRAIVRNALRQATTRNMSAQQAVTLVEMEIGLPDSDAENLLDQYGDLIRRTLGERVYRDLYERAVSNKARR